MRTATFIIMSAKKSPSSQTTTQSPMVLIVGPIVHWRMEVGSGVLGPKLLRLDFGAATYQLGRKLASGRLRGEDAQERGCSAAIRGLKFRGLFFPASFTSSLYASKV